MLDFAFSWRIRISSFPCLCSRLGSPKWWSNRGGGIMHTEVSLSPQSTRPNFFGHYSPARPRVPGVVAEVAYLSPETEQPYTFMYRPPDGTAWDNCTWQ